MVPDLLQSERAGEEGLGEEVHHQWRSKVQGLWVDQHLQGGPTDTRGTEHSHRENFLNRNQILKLNALDPRDLGDEESDRLCAKLLKKSQVAYEFEPQTIPDDEKLLVLHKYIHFEGTAHKTVHNESKVLGTEKDLSKSVIKDASSSNVKI